MREIEKFNMSSHALRCGENLFSHNISGLVRDVTGTRKLRCQRVLFANKIVLLSLRKLLIFYGFRGGSAVLECYFSNNDFDYYILTDKSSSY